MAKIRRNGTISRPTRWAVTTALPNVVIGDRNHYGFKGFGFGRGARKKNFKVPVFNNTNSRFGFGFGLMPVKPIPFYGLNSSG